MDPYAIDDSALQRENRRVALGRRLLSHGLRTMPRALNLIFGMASPVAAAISQMGVPEIDRIAMDEGPHLRARWPESRSFWKGLLRAAIGTDDQALANVHLHCLQLLGSEVVLP